MTERETPPARQALFSEGLVVSRPRGSGPHHRGIGAVSMLLHTIALALLIFVPIFFPPPMPPRADVLVNLIYNPPPPPPPPLQKGSPLRPQPVKPEVPKPVVEKPAEKTFIAPLETTPREAAKLEPQQGVRPDEQFGSETGSEFGDALGMDGGVEGGVVGGVLGGVLGGELGGTGTGPVADYDTGPRLMKKTTPVYPEAAFRNRVQGTVLLEILIDASGRVVKSRVLHSIPLLDEAARQTVAQWLFQPAIKHGRPVATIAHAPVQFRIY